VNELQKLFGDGEGSLKENQEVLKNALFEADKVEMLLPVFIRDYTDFYSSKNHAYNVGVMIRGPE